jgi:hypothetical protein
MIEDQWWGCYQESLKGWCVDAAFAHPAKVSLALAKRIYQHAMAEGWIQPGKDLVVDPMAGVSVFGLVAASLGIQWQGIELEPRFIEWSQQNIALHTPEWTARGKPIPRIIQGDARQLQALLEKAECILSSPPYVHSVHSGNGIDPTKLTGNPAGKHSQAFVEGYSAIISSPPYNLPMSQDHNGSKGGGRGTQPSETGAFVKYGNSPGQIEGLAMGDVQAVISSPPYVNSVNAESCGIDWDKMGPATGKRKRGPGTKHYETLKAQLAYQQPSAIVSSPPFVDARQDTTPSRKGKTAPTKHDPEAWTQPSAIVSSPPYADIVPHHQGPPTARNGRTDQVSNYGTSPSQIGSMPEGNLAAIISSPPYSEGLSKEHTYTNHEKRDRDSHRRIMTEKGIVDPFYGATNGNLGNLPSGDLTAIVTSPPYADAQVGPQNSGNEIKQRRQLGLTASSHEYDGYGSTDGNVGNLSHDTYWSAMASIYRQCFEILPVGGAIILVLKGFVRKGRYIDLPAQTAQLLTHVGFTVLHMHQAMLTSQVGQMTLDGGEDRKSRKSFFRRLAEAKGAPVIDHEIVLCARKETA